MLLHSTNNNFVHKIIVLSLGFIGSILLLDAIMLFSYKKFSFGTILPFVIGIIFLIHSIFWQKIQLLLQTKIYLKRIWQLLWLIFFLWCLSFVYFAYSLKQQIKPANQLNSPKAIIVLGSGIEGNQPTPTLAKRLDKSAMVFQQYPNTPMIVSGGIGFGKTYSEAEIMSKYLNRKFSIPKQYILQEAESTSTELNLINSKPILQQHHIHLNDPIIIVTSDFHTIRAKAIAQKQGYQNINMVASETPLYIRYNAWLREYFAFMSGWLLQEY